MRRVILLPWQGRGKGKENDSEVQTLKRQNIQKINKQQQQKAQTEQQNHKEQLVQEEKEKSKDKHSN
jgi:hypothetical protein